jgi:hypothetical protein
MYIFHGRGVVDVSCWPHCCIDLSASNCDCYCCFVALVVELAFHVC